MKFFQNSWYFVQVHIEQHRTTWKRDASEIVQRKCEHVSKDATWFEKTLEESKLNIGKWQSRNNKLTV